MIGRAAERRLGSGSIESIGSASVSVATPATRPCAAEKIGGFLIAIDSSLSAKRIFYMAG